VAIVYRGVLIVVRRICEHRVLRLGAINFMVSNVATLQGELDRRMGIFRLSIERRGPREDCALSVEAGRDARDRQVIRLEVAGPEDS